MKKVVDAEEEFDEEGEDSEDEEFDEPNEKVFELVVADGSKVYFLESSGAWWSNTFDSSDVAKVVANSFNKG